MADPQFNDNAKPEEVTPPDTGELSNKGSDNSPSEPAVVNDKEKPDEVTTPDTRELSNKEGSDSGPTEAELVTAHVTFKTWIVVFVCPTRLPFCLCPLPLT